MAETDLPEWGDREVAALAAWEVAEPPPGFADRVVAARAEGAPRATEPAARSFGRAVPIAVAGVLAVAAIAWSVGRSSVMPPSSGTLMSVERQTVTLGTRGIAVAEPGAALTWRIDGDGARLSQNAGDVFYRVEPGGPFAVVTPAGRVEVTGTCFRVEVRAMRKAPVQGLVGAALGAVVVVTVYEGSVLFADKAGKQSQVVAGQRVESASEGGEAIRPERGSPAVTAASPPTDISREDLLARDQVQRDEIAVLRDKVRALEHGGPGAGRRGIERDPSGRPWFDPSKEDLARFAQECRVRIDMPPMRESRPWQIEGDEIEEAVREYGLAPAEIPAINRAISAVHRRFVAAVRAIYVEVTGDEAGADSLSPEAMGSEIRDKSGPGEDDRVRQQVARERAGLAAAPVDPSAATPFERYFRLLALVGDQTEQELAKEVGAARARAIRAMGGGWPNHMEMAGC